MTSMSSSERYKRLNSGKTGELRELAYSMIADADRLPGKAALKAAILELIPDDHEDLGPVRAAVEKRLVELAQKSQDKSERFSSRGYADEWALETASKLEARDRLVEVEEDEPVDWQAIRKATDRYSDTIGGDRERELAEEREAARELLRKAGQL